MKFAWDDVRVFLEVERTGRMIQAGRRLGVSHTTVARRLRALEAALGAPLFDPGEDGLTLTQTGRAMLDQARQMETAAHAVVDQVNEALGQSRGRVRIGAPDGFGNAVLSHLLPELAIALPNISIEFVPIPAVHRLWRRDVDIAISLDRPETGRLVMRRLIDYDLRVYAGLDYFREREPPRDAEELSAHPFVGYVDELLYTDELDFNRHFPVAVDVVYKAATVKAQLDAVRSNIALGVLPCFIAKEDELVPVLAQELTFHRTYWILYLEESRALSHVREVAEFIYRRTRALRSRFRHLP